MFKGAKCASWAVVVKMMKPDAIMKELALIAKV